MSIAYKVLRCRTFGELEREVTAALDEGWILAGGVATSPAQFEIRGARCYDEITGWLVAQAITKGSL